MISNCFLAHRRTTESFAGVLCHELEMKEVMTSLPLPSFLLLIVHATCLLFHVPLSEQERPLLTARRETKLLRAGYNKIARLRYLPQTEAIIKRDCS